MSHRLFLSSKSESRHALLRMSGIPFVTIDQSADESKCNWALPLNEVVTHIALFKMKHAILPFGHFDEQIAYVLTADTLTQDADGTIHGKPLNRDDAREMIRLSGSGNTAATAFCIEKRIWSANQWNVIETSTECVNAFYRFIVPEQYLDDYLNRSPSISCANATSIENFGLQFLKDVHGSYTTILGLPLFELREALEKIGFITNKH